MKRNDESAELDAPHAREANTSAPAGKRSAPTPEASLWDSDECDAGPVSPASVPLSSAPSEHPPAAAPHPPARVVAKIIDPSVRDDGRGDPQFSMEPRRDRVLRTPSIAGGVHPVRQRLLSRARAALSAAAEAEAEAAAAPNRRAPAANDAWFSAERTEPSDDEAADAGPAPAPDVADDLDLIGAPERPRPERTPHVTPALTAPTRLLLGTLAGLVAIGALFAGLSWLDPHEPLRVTPPPLAKVEPAPAIEAPAPPPTSKVQRPALTRVPGPWRIPEVPEARFQRIQANVGARSFLGATQTAGLNLKEAYRVLTAFEGIKNLDRCRPKDTFTALVDADTGRLSAFEYAVSEEDVYQAREGADGRLSARKLDLQVDRHRAQGVVIVDGSFEDSAQRAGFEPGLGEFVNKALAGYVSTAQLSQGDVLGVVVQEVTVLGAFSRYAGVEAVEYRPVNGEPFRIYYQEHEKSRGYVDAKGRVFGKSRWTRPVPGAGVTSRFNPKRLHPILKRVKPHNGTDFGAPIGTPVVAAGAGKVAFIGRAGPNGNMITIAHDGGLQTGYSHLSRFVKGLKVGARVEKQQPIGYVGSTGRSTGPHLHFSTKKNGRFIDPESLNLDGLLRLTVDQRASSELRRKYDRMLDSLRLPPARAPIAALTQHASGTPPASSDPSAQIEVEIASARAAPPSAAPTLNAPALSNAVPMQPLGKAGAAAAPAPTSSAATTAEAPSAGTGEPAVVATGSSAPTAAGSEAPAPSDTMAEPTLTPELAGKHAPLTPEAPANALAR